MATFGHKGGSKGQPRAGTSLIGLCYLPLPPCSVTNFIYARFTRKEDLPREKGGKCRWRALARVNLLSRILGLFVETRQISFRPELYSLREFMNLSTLAASIRFTVKRSACKRYRHGELSRRSLTSTEPRNGGKRLKRCFLRIAFLKSG